MLFRSQADRDRLAYLKSAYGTTTDMRNAIPFLNDPDIDGYSIADAKQDYQKAWSQFRKVPSVGMPTFKRRTNSYSYGTNCHYNPSLQSDIVGLFEGSVRFLDKTHVHLPILGRIRIKGSKKLIASLLERTAFTRIGTVVDTPKYLRKSERKLKKAQRKLSRMYECAKKDNRKLRESKNYQKQRQKLAEIHKHVANQRMD